MRALFMSMPVSVTGSAHTNVSSDITATSCAGVSDARIMIEPSHTSVTVPPSSLTWVASVARSFFAASTMLNSRAGAVPCAKTADSASSLNMFGSAPTQRTHGKACTAASAGPSARTIRQFAGRKCRISTPARANAVRYSATTWVWNCTRCSRVPVGTPSTPGYCGIADFGSNCPCTVCTRSFGGASSTHEPPPSRLSATWLPVASAHLRIVIDPIVKRSS
jgi:hypothetical protein